LNDNNTALNSSSWIRILSEDLSHVELLVAIGWKKSLLISVCGGIFVSAFLWSIKVFWLNCVKNYKFIFCLEKSFVFCSDAWKMLGDLVGVFAACFEFLGEYFRSLRYTRAENVEEEVKKTSRRKKKENSDYSKVDTRKLSGRNSTSIRKPKHRLDSKESDDS
jgi:hypothetical protein